MNIGEQIKKLRKHNKVTREDLATILNVSAQQLYKYETGRNKIPVQSLVSIALYFDVSLDYFIEEETRVLKHQNFTLQEKEILNIFLSLSAPKQNLFLKIARQFNPQKAQKKEK